MRIFILAALTATASLLCAALAGRARAEGAPPIISGPFVHGNLAIYFIHGESAPGAVPLTLQEAMAKGTARVVETGSVNELKIENSGEEDVFVQSGDIVKGGRQDRVLTVSFILPRKSGEVPVASYCVEHGRWSARGTESASHFSGSINALPSRAAKLAMKELSPADAMRPAGGATDNAYAHAFSDTSRRQSQVWAEVAKTQENLSASLNEPVAAPASATSLELSLENSKLKELREAYTQALEGKAAGDDIVGFAFAVNGRINSADIYPSNGLFRKMWAKLLNASITEAVGERTDTTSGSTPSIEAVRDFLAAAEKGTAHAQKIGNLAQQEMRDAAMGLFVEAARPSGDWVHRNYLAK
jgi:hypothetical protein